jgi:hypothetical protein
VLVVVVVAIVDDDDDVDQLKIKLITFLVIIFAMITTKPYHLR